MKQIGELPDGSPLYYADETFVTPGFFVWDADQGDHVHYELRPAPDETDHKTEARNYAEAADREASTLNIAGAHSFAAVSSAYSNLAIAEGQEAVAVAVTGVQAELQDLREGQERVAEELAGLRKLFASTNGAFAEIQVDGHVTTGAP